MEKYPRIREPTDYAKSYFWYNAQVKYDMLIWQNYPLPKSLTVFSRKDCRDDDEWEFLHEESKHIFKQICCIQGHCMYRNPKDLPFKIIEKGIKYHAIRDEIYMQLIKQTRRNPDLKSALKAWKLLYLCLSSFTPSYEMGLVLLSHIAKHGRTNGIGTFDTVEDVARHCYYAWINCMKGETQKIEIKDTWKLMMRHEEKLIHVKIHCFDGSFAKISVPNSYTIAQTTRIVMEYFGLSQHRNDGCWLIRGISTDIQTNIKLFFTSPSISLLHVTSRWYQEKRCNKNVSKIKFVLYRRIWKLEDRIKDRYLEDPAFTRLAAKQCLRDFNEGILQTNTEDMSKIIAISIVLYHKARPLKYGESSWDHLSRFVPKWARNKLEESMVDHETWIDSVVDIVKTLVYTKFAREQDQRLLDRTSDDTQSDEMEKLLDNEQERERHFTHLSRLHTQLMLIFIESDYFGLSLFCGNIIDLRYNKKTEGILKVNERLVLFTSNDHNEILYHYNFEDIRDVEVIYVEYQKCLKFVLFVEYEEYEELGEITEQVIFETDEAQFVSDLIGNLLRDTNQNYSILY